MYECSLCGKKFEQHSRKKHHEQTCQIQGLANFVDNVETIAFMETPKGSTSRIKQTKLGNIALGECINCGSTITEQDNMDSIKKSAYECKNCEKIQLIKKSQTTTKRKGVTKGE